MGWRYIAQRFTGEGEGEFLDWDLPITNPAITTNLSGPNQLTGQIDRFYEHLVADDDRQLLEPWGVSIFAEADNQIRGGGIFVSPDATGPGLKIDCAGYTYYAKDIYYDGAWYGVGVDPLDVVRRIWDHIQTQPGGNIGLELGATTTPVRIGTELEEVKFQAETSPGVRETVSFEAGPVKLNWWTTDNLGGKIDELAKSTPFDYLETHAWDGDQIRHRLDFGHPRIGSRKDDLRFAVGENISVLPAITRNGEDFATEMMVTGAGEGRDMIRSPAVSTRKPGQLRRVAQLNDKKLKSIRDATERARYELSLRRAEPTIGEVVIREHDNAPIGSFEVGDEIPVIIKSDWYDIDSWVRIVSKTIYPDQADVAKLKVVRTDRGVL